ncbi:MAG: FAD-dependent oxidoreductase [Hydrogenophaga sp.]|uniref:FAD-dependent oxidoreductase n=1 Tax=Hydrogenophaga sp. TaxID=1904254 RepID=UPI0016ADE466|nr:FAD-dependent oxidoreductase [Hydrogenophaga sp.]NIM43725.1 FAD-dependent oxidoreductase [Hydrogenophaga sp.]NIN28794.1 FAD-dependent oxidoreductase [Hydrogenophaga sp.]NIN33253.1 FAD-dependent oxidoreductase [Hydrogenophaga sp.]NIN57928.1 FAD-dependent oxidoreductase [Hydrogenophaga sp.]NIO54223.1 FAD-dependent oxidoreductase [Hydrogenophaga sp.]
MDTARHALVIGAGLAGAAVTAALCRRGWRVALLDAAPGPAMAASALPVGVLSPHLTRQPTPMSRLTALGVPVTRAELERLVPPGAGWMPVEVDNRGAHAPGRQAAALVRPGALVRAWLAEADERLQAHWSASVATLGREQGQWLARNAAGEPLARAPHAVIAAALGARHLAPEAAGPWPLGPVLGQMSLAALDGAPLAERPQRDDGVFVPEYRDSGLAPQWPSAIWAMGSTYARGQTDTALNDAAHRDNAARLRDLVPAAADRLDGLLADGRLLGWAGVRCASMDRLPLVGAAPDPLSSAVRQRAVAAVPRLPGLWLLSALGSRGLSLAAACGQWLAAEMEGETPALDADLRAAIDPARFAWRRARRGP